MHTSPAPIESTCGVNPWPVAPAQQYKGCLFKKVLKIVAWDCENKKILDLQFVKDSPDSTITADFFSRTHYFGKEK